jgi:hypothetical protein
MRWVGQVAGVEQRRKAYRVLVGKLEEKRQLGRPRSRYEDIIKMDLTRSWTGKWTGLIRLRKGTGGGRLKMW